MQHADKFEETFGNFYAGKYPTESRNSYFILDFNFSGIDTTTNETTYRDFLSSVRSSINRFLSRYSKYFEAKHKEELNSIPTPQNMMKQLWDWVENKGNGKQIYVLIDEYDQFANEI